MHTGHIPYEIHSKLNTSSLIRPPSLWYQTASFNEFWSGKYDSLLRFLFDVQDGWYYKRNFTVAKETASSSCLYWPVYHYVSDILTCVSLCFSHIDLCITMFQSYWPVYHYVSAILTCVSLHFSHIDLCITIFQPYWPVYHYISGSRMS